MKFLQLNFSQKIWLGFGIIVLLLSLSSILSLYNLSDINNSTTQVNENAVPVLKQSNQAQINLLKQAKISSSGYTADTLIEIDTFSREFEGVAVEFQKQFEALTETVKLDESMSEYVTEAEKHYKTYNDSVKSMFAAKKELLRAKDLANKEVQNVSNMVDDAGALLLDVVWTEYGEDDESREIMEGIQGRLDGLIIGVYNLVDEINRSQDIEYLQNSKSAIQEAFSGIQVRNNHAETVLADLRGRETWQSYLTMLTEAKVKTTSDNSISDIKLRQVEQSILARELLATSDAAIAKVVSEFDQLLGEADALFNEKQNGVLETVDLGSKSAIIAWIILLLMASQNFNSMRKSIKKKMADLAKLNSTGEVLASLLNKDKALEEVLAAMHEQTGVARGSVYLMNEEEQLEVKAFYPPKAVKDDTKAARFALGEGILGKAAESKEILYVPNTSKDSNFVSDSNMPAKALLCVPLVDKDVLIGVMNFSGDVKEVNFEDSDYEFASSIARLLVTTIKNIRMRETIEEQNRTLEEKVKARTAELHQKNKDIAVMMANLHQGLFTIIEGGIVHPEYSKYLEEILSTSQIANRNFMDLLFADTNLGSDQTNQIATAVDSLLGMDEMMFDFNSHLLVNEVVMNRKDGKQVILEIDWVPIVNQNTDEIEKILVTVRDVTELRALQLEAEAQKRELEIIGQILAVSPDKFSDFISSSLKFVDECRELINKTTTKDLDVVALLFRNMHTVKGNARTYDFKYITDSVHEAEHTYDELRKDDDKTWDQSALLEELALAESDIKVYQKTAKDKLSGLFANASGTSSLVGENIQKLINEVTSLDTNTLSHSVKTWIQDAYQVFTGSQAESVKDVLSPVIESVNSLALELGKEQPEVKINDAGALIKRDAHSLLNNVFMHVFRNAMDHGIETPESRTEKGKPPQGLINFDTHLADAQIVFEIKDDGKGLALEKIYQSAIDKGIFTEDQARPPAQEIANLVFHSGFSTAEAVTEISGRGVGMDAVKNFLEENQGNIEIILGEGQEDDEYRPFITRISLSDDIIISGEPLKNIA